MDINVLNEFVWGKERSKSLSHSGSGNETSEGKSFPATRSDGFFQRIYQQAATGIAITDWLGVLQECNPAYSALLGYTEEELRSVDFASLVHPEDREANLAQIRRLQAGEISSFDIENRYLHKNGAPVWVHKFVSVLPGENGEPGHLIALVTNTTGRHHAEQRASEARLRLALEASDAGTWSWDARTNQTQWDERYGSMYGISGETPRHETWVARIHPEDRPRVLARINEVRNTPGDDIWNVEFRAIRPDGIVIWMHGLGRAARDAKGQLLSLSGINVDITERKRREANSAFSAEVTAVLSKLSTLDEIMQAFGPRIAGFLKVSSVHYWDVDDDRNEWRLHSIWAASDAPALPALVHLGDYLTDDIIRAIRAGETTVIRDTETDPRVDSMAARAIKQRTAVVVPFLQRGKLRFVLSLSDQNPRNWHEDEIELIKEQANGIFPLLERARAEEALRESEQRYRRLAEQVFDGIFVTDSQGRYEDANRAGCEMFGYTLEELKTLTVRDVIAPEELQKLPEQFQHLASGQVVRSDWRFKRKDASVFTGELVCRQFSDGRLQGIVRDITERKTAELAVRASEQQLQSYLDHAGEGIYVMESESGRILNANNHAVQMLGYSRDELLKLCAADIESAHPPPGNHAFQQQAIQEVVAVEGIHRRKDGSTFPVEIRLTSLSPAQPHLVLALVRDITERKRIEEELKAANVFLDAIIENIPLMLFIKESQSLRFVRLNRAAEDLLGWPKQTLIGKNAYDYWPNEQADFFVEKDRETLKSGSIVDIPEEPIQTRYRGVRILHTKKVPVLDTTGNPIYLLGISVDITERKRIEKEQRFLADVNVALSSSLEYEQTLVTLARLVVQNIADWCAVDVMDEQGQLSRLKVASADPDQAALCTVLEQMPPDRDLPHLMRSVIESKRPIVVEHVTLQYIESLAQTPEHLQALLATGTTSLVAVPLLMRGQPLGALVFTSSTPSHVYGQSDLRLGEALAERAAIAIENATLYRASVRATQLRDQMLSIVAHDLRNPLATILIQASAQKRRSPELERRSQKPAEVINRAAKRIDRLIQDLLDVALMEAGQLTIERSRQSAGGLIVEAADMQRPLASSSSLELRVQVDPHVPEVWGDRDRLLQVFENLIGNAIKFTEAGGRITVGAASRGDEVAFRIADTGCGIESENLGRIFDRFWQASRAGRRGAGLGLPITKGIVEAHGGRIWVESAAVPFSSRFP
jgi:PAS domain S-box-containing protein